MDLKRIVFGNATLGNGAADVGAAILRVYTGATLALVHGSQKMPPSAGFVDGVAHLGFPLPFVFAWAASLAELLGGLLLALGLLTRPAAFFVAFTMGVAAFVQHAHDPFSVKELALAYFAVAVSFIFVGSGRYGLDAWIGGGKK